MKWMRDEIVRHFMMAHVSSGIIAWFFGVSGPLLIVLQAADKGSLPPEITSSWIFAIYVTGGLLTVIFSFIYRQPIAFAFTIPGAVLVGTSLANHSFPVVLGAYLVTGILVLVLGLSRSAETFMKAIPMPIIMGMVSGVLLPFGTDIVRSVWEHPALNGLTLFAFLLISLFGFVAKKIPPLLGAMIVAALLLPFFGYDSSRSIAFQIASPQLYMPEFDWSVLGELVIPLAVTVVAIQNSQGIGILRSAEYMPPINPMTNWTGIGSIVNSFMGAHSVCIAGPMTAILSEKENGPAQYRYLGALVMGSLWMAFGFLAPMAVSITESIPASLIKLLGGLALIGVLVNSFQISFANRYKIGALFSFMITIADVSLLRIGAPFWGLVGGVVISLILEKRDWHARD